jgi:hypothetical protein
VPAGLLLFSEPENGDSNVLLESVYIYSRRGQCPYARRRRCMRARELTVPRPISPWRVGDSVPRRHIHPSGSVQAQMTSVLTLNPPCSDSETEKTTQAAWQRGRRDQHAPDVDPSKSDGPWLGKVAGARRPTASRRRAPPWTRCALFVRLVVMTNDWC